MTSCTVCTSTDVNAGTAFAMGASSFTNASLKGSYELNSEWWTSSASPTASCALATVTFDGVSKITLSWILNSGGTLATFTGAGTYSVNADGSGTMTFVPSGSTTTISDSFVLNSASATGLGAKGLQHMTTAESSGSLTGYVTDGTATKQ